MAREALEQHKAERVNVALRADCGPRGLLGAQVGSGARGGAFAGHSFHIFAERDSEVAELRSCSWCAVAVVDQQDVRRLDVAVHHARSVYVFERLGDVESDLGDVARADGTRRESRLEVGAAHELHHQVAMAVAVLTDVDAGVEQVDQTVVVEARQNGELGLLAAGVDRTRLREEFDGNRSAEHLVVRAEHRRHAAAPEDGLEPISLAEESVGSVWCLLGHVLHPSPQVYLLPDRALNFRWGLTGRDFSFAVRPPQLGERVPLPIRCLKVTDRCASGSLEQVLDRLPRGKLPASVQSDAPGGLRPCPMSSRQIRWQSSS